MPTARSASRSKNLTAMLKGELEPATGFMMGKLKVSWRHERRDAPAARDLIAFADPTE
jgi:putative sterol carrier protein